MKNNMKKILIPVLSLLAVFSAVSCATQEEQDFSHLKGVLSLEAYDVPDTVAVNKRQQKTFNIKVTAPEICGKTLTVTLGVNADLVAAYNEEHNTNYEMLPSEAYNFSARELMLPRFNKVSSLGQINLVGFGCKENQPYVLPVVIEKIAGSEDCQIADSAVVYFLYKMLPALKGVGTKDDPYVIEELKDFTTMGEKLLSGETSYFEMKTDIDMSEVEDFPLLNPNPYSAQIFFDGKGHKISNYKGTNGFFHVLNGTVQNVTFENCEVTGGAGTGLLAHYLGYIKDANTYTANVKNVKFNECKFTGTGNDSGLLCAYAYSSVVENVYMENCECTFGARRHGFLAGRIEGASAEFKNCYVKGGKVIKGTQQVGGLIGQNNLVTAKVTYCGYSAEFEGTNRNMAAIMAYAKSDAVPGAAGTTTIENCIVWTPSIVCATNTGDLYSSGVFVGASEQNNVYYKNNYRRADLVFADYMEGMNDLRDVADVAGSPVPAGPVGTHNFPYHGKAAAAGKTASQVAKELGWDQTVWDLNGAEPMPKF